MTDFKVKPEIQAMFDESGRRREAEKQYTPMIEAQAKRDVIELGGSASHHAEIRYHNEWQYLENSMPAARCIGIYIDAWQEGRPYRVYGNHIGGVRYIEAHADYEEAKHRAHKMVEEEGHVYAYVYRADREYPLSSLGSLLHKAGSDNTIDRQARFDPNTPWIRLYFATLPPKVAEAWWSPRNEQ